MTLSALLSCAPNKDRHNELLETAKKYELNRKYAEAKIEARNALKLNPNSAEAYLVLGRCSMQEQDLRAAYSSFSQALSLEPENQEALAYMAKIMLGGGDAEQAINYLEMILKQNPDSIEAKNMMAGALLRQNKLDEAQVILKQILKNHPDNEDATAGLASIYSLRNEPQKAQQVLLDALTRNPGNPRLVTLLLNQAMANNNHTDAQKFIQLLLDIDPDNQNIILRQSELYFRAGNPATGYEILEKFLSEHPEAESVRLRLAELYAGSNNMPKAIEILDAAPQKTPELRLLKGVSMLRSGDIEGALVELKAVAANPSSRQAASRAQLVIADVYSSRGDANLAIQELSSLLQRTPGNIEAMTKRAHLYITQRKFEDAISDLRFVAREMPNDHTTAITLANAQNAVGNTHLAEEGLKDVLKKAPGNALAYLTLANLYLQQQKIDDAIETLRFGRNKVGDIADLHFTEADILSSQGRYSEAISALGELVKKEKFQLATEMKMAAIYAQAGDYPQSISMYDRVLAQVPDFLEAAEARMRTQIASGKSADALAYAEKRQKERPNDPTAAALVGETALATGNLEKAESAFLSAMSRAPQWDQPVLRLAQLYSSTNRLEDGIKSCRVILDKQPDALAPMLLMALLQERQGEIAAAEISYRNILSKQPNMPIACNNMANLLSLHSPTPERLAEAESYAAIAVLSKAPEAYSTLGWIYHLQGRHILAEAELRKAFTTAKNDALIKYRLAVALVAINKKSDAKLLLDELIDDKSDSSIQTMAQKLLQSIQ